ncbi:putative DNA binding domain-containing protein [Limnothrix sp. FACHB-1083]|uniref:ATP-binding protein n=1 Tax=unclassified Limnothrix TaxID=2632864 RepID=UPI001681280C|nr:MULTISPECIES: RNA-binding domain-containing protein [unclassified Limnothrix]MBD2161539.1 putative DNA binding domain-containing protein [Limnothrix sp. FACHB-1083]MBD2192253.1 putative DNA binding domain-containing protein [Limnothrix sp. FACHB-1088]
MKNSRNLEQLKIIKSFIDAWTQQTTSKKFLYLKSSTFNTLSNVEFEGYVSISSLDEIDSEDQFDLIIGDLPMFLQRSIKVTYQDKSITIPENWSEILNSSAYLTNEGTGLFILEPSMFITEIGRKFENVMNKNGLYVNAIFNLPERILEPETVITPLIVAIKKIDPSRIFVAELTDEDQSKKVVDSFHKLVDGGDIRSGKFLKAGSFRSFHRLQASQQIERLETQYKNYSEYTLLDISIEINSVQPDELFQERENSIYIPRIAGSSVAVVSQIEYAKLKHHNYFQVVLKDFALNEYVAAFFRSTLGKLTLSSLASSTATLLPRFHKKELEQALIALPTPEEQLLIVETQRALTRLKTAIDKFDSELALNPMSSSAIQKQLNTMLDVVGNLTDADRIRGLIREGETKHIEFKETLSLDVRKQTKEKYLETEAVQTVVAFLNTQGGILLIGVADNGELVGLNHEIDKFYKGNVDKFILRWKDLLKDRIGEGCYTFLEYRMINMQQKFILWVECKASPFPFYLDKTEFYFRTHPATHRLDGPKLVEYVKNRFFNK